MTEMSDSGELSYLDVPDEPAVDAAGPRLPGRQVWGTVAVLLVATALFQMTMNIAAGLLYHAPRVSDFGGFRNNLNAGQRISFITSGANVGSALTLLFAVLVGIGRDQHPRFGVAVFIACGLLVALALLQIGNVAMTPTLRNLFGRGSLLSGIVGPACAAVLAVATAWLSATTGTSATT
jgi:hypothetical protein